MTVYLARGLKAGDAQPEEDESIECHLTPLSQALEMVRSGEICDGKTIAAVLWLAESVRSGESCEVNHSGPKSPWDDGFRPTARTARASRSRCGFWSIYSLDNTTKRGANLTYAVQQANPTGQM